MSALEEALQKFEAAEANLEKLEKLWAKISALIPEGPAFGAPAEYDELCLAFRGILPALPAIGGVRVQDHLYDYDEAGQMRLDALELGEIEVQVSVSNTLEEQGKSLREYRFLLTAKRRELVRSRMITLIEDVDNLLEELIPTSQGAEPSESVSTPQWSRLIEAVQEIETLLGSNPKPNAWGYLMRHLHFGQMADLTDIYKSDWPAVRSGLRIGIYGENDPIPVGVADLEEIVLAHPQGPVTSKLNWAILSDEDFERLIFSLVSEAAGYENPQWLQHTNAPDRGRDISVSRVDADPLADVRRSRVIIQCKNWQSRSVAAADIGELRTQMELWSPPRVDELIIATTGRFTADAVALVEQQNQSDRALHISMWPDSHLERLLAARPHLIAQFRLRQRN